MIPGVNTVGSSNNWLNYLGGVYGRQQREGLSKGYENQLRSTATNRIDKGMIDARKANEENLASGGLLSSGLGSVANAKLAGERADAISQVDANIANLDYQAQQQGLSGLMGVQQGYQQRDSFDEQRRQFDEQLRFQNKQLDFEKEQAKYTFGDFFGDIAGLGGQVLGGWAGANFGNPVGAIKKDGTK
jgi:hypothetical protein